MTDAPIKSLLIANRSEIAIRVMRVAAEMDIRAVAIYSKEDRLALHRVKSDESYLVGEGKKPLAAYLDIDDILRSARQANVDTFGARFAHCAKAARHGRGKALLRRVLRSKPLPRKIVSDQLRSYRTAKTDIPELAYVKHVKAGK
jgi:hypothetical protein